MSKNLLIQGIRLSSSSSSSGSIRAAGGSFAKREQAQEDQYFRKMQTEQLESLKNHVYDQIDYHHKEIQRHEKALERMKHIKKTTGELKEEMEFMK